MTTLIIYLTKEDLEKIKQGEACEVAMTSTMKTAERILIRADMSEFNKE